MNEAKLMVHDSFEWETGVIVAGTPMSREQIQPSHEGLVLAHDLIEHVNGVEHIGGAGDELMALGAIWCTRGLLGDMRRDRPPYLSSEESLGVEVAECFSRWVVDDECFNFPLPDRANEMDEDAIKYILQYGRNHSDSYLQHYDDFAAEAAVYIDAGYATCLKRYGDCVTANRVFWNIAEEIDRSIFGRYAELWEGMEWRLRWNDYETHLEVIEGYEY